MTANTDGRTEVFDVANWLDRANGRVAGAPAPAVESTPMPPAYVPRHRADVPVDSADSVA